MGLLKRNIPPYDTFLFHSAARPYEEDGSAAWAYTLALLAYRDQDPDGSTIAREAGRPICMFRPCSLV